MFLLIFFIRFRTEWIFKFFNFEFIFCWTLIFLFNVLSIFLLCNVDFKNRFIYWIFKPVNWSQDLIHNFSIILLLDDFFLYLFHRFFLWIVSIQKFLHSFLTVLIWWDWMRIVFHLLRFKYLFDFVDLLKLLLFMLLNLLFLKLEVIVVSFHLLDLFMNSFVNLQNRFCFWRSFIQFHLLTFDHEFIRRLLWNRFLFNWLHWLSTIRSKDSHRILFWSSIALFWL